MNTTHHDDSHFRVARRVEDISASSIFRINQRAQELAGQGCDIVRLDAGEPDFDTPKPIVDAAKAALDDGYTRYTPMTKHSARGSSAYRMRSARRFAASQSAP